MKIILISDNKIFGFGGGSLEERKYYDGLKTYAESHNGEIKVISIDAPFEDSFPVAVKKNRWLDLSARIMGHSTYMYWTWQQNKREIIAYAPDVVVLGRSRMGFIARELKRKIPKCKVICNMENVEYDYVTGYFADSNSILKKAYIAWEKICTKRDETTAIKHSGAINYLTQRDKNRTHELYDVFEKQEMILPICINSETKLILNSQRKNVVFVGSLGYGSNVEAITWFITEVWKPHFENREGIHLIIAGNNPQQPLKELVKTIPNCTLHDGFGKLEDIVPKYSLMIAPIKHGAGMKVKVAETLSMGLIIAASDEALVGYEEALCAGEKLGLMRANTPDEYTSAINQYIAYAEDKLAALEQTNKNIYSQYYNYNRSRESINKLLAKLVRE